METGFLKRAINRVLYIQTRVPYERFLRAVCEQGDAWIVSQGEFILWWQQRNSSDLKINVRNGVCHVTTDLSNAVIENYPADFYASPEITIPCPDNSLDGSVLITIDKKLRQRALFKEALRREGILNFREGSDGEFFFSTEVSPILEEMSFALSQSDLEHFHQCIVKVRELITERLARRGLPLLRIWYHPCINNRIIKVAVSPRHDVERAITNMPKFWDLERKYQASSTVHLRAFCPFYSQRRIHEITRHPTCPEIALHGEFVGHASRFGGLLDAAMTEKKKLEEITGRELLGVSLHGGELIENNTVEAQNTVPKVGFLYNASMAPTPYYFPYRLYNEDGSFEVTYRMHANFGDIRIPYSERYAQDFYDEAMRQVRIASKCGGILVMMLHPAYFDLLSYLLNLSNLTKLLLFLPIYLRRLVNARKSVGGGKTVTHP